MCGQIHSPVLEFYKNFILTFENRFCFQNLHFLVKISLLKLNFLNLHCVKNHLVNLQIRQVKYIEFQAVPAVNEFIEAYFCCTVTTYTIDAKGSRVDPDRHISKFI